MKKQLKCTAMMTVALMGSIFGNHDGMQLFESEAMKQKDGVQEQTKKFSWEHTIWFFDFDDTVVDTSLVHTAASQEVFNVLAPLYGDEKARIIQQRFEELYYIMFDGYHVRNQQDWEHVHGGKEAYQDLLRRIMRVQDPIVKKYGQMKRWSREVFLVLAFDDVYAPESVKPFRIANDVDKAINAYWNRVAELSVPFPDVLPLFQTIRVHKRPIYIVTSSDCRMHLDRWGTFCYDPQKSEEFKVARVEKLKDKGIMYDGIVVGDPEDKPGRDYFEKAIHRARSDVGSEIDHKHFIIVGDSYPGDLATPKETLGFGLAIYIDREKKDEDTLDGTLLTTKDLRNVLSYFED